jgi:uncharacterized protein (DUF1697 family)
LSKHLLRLEGFYSLWLDPDCYGVSRIVTDLPRRNPRAPAVTAFVAWVRGINVGGRAKLSMATLRETASNLQLEHVQTYLQSGNLLFQAAPGRRRGLADELEVALHSSAGLDARVILRTKDELAKIVAGNPFLPGDLPGNKMHVAFLAGTPKRDRIRSLDPNRSPPDEFQVRGKDIYLSYPGGSGRSKLTIDYFERSLALAATARNWNTVTKVLDLMSS